MVLGVLTDTQLLPLVSPSSLHSHPDRRRACRRVIDPVGGGEMNKYKKPYQKRIDVINNDAIQEALRRAERDMLGRDDRSFVKIDASLFSNFMSSVNELIHHFDNPDDMLEDGRYYIDRVSALYEKVMKRS